jgi:hypothetical protein
LALLEKEELQVDWNTLEALTDDLKSLVAYGAKPQHVIARPTLRDLVETKHPFLTTAALKQAIVHELKVAADAWADDKKAEQARWLLALGRRYEAKAVVRRENAIRLADVWHPVETWRRIPELNFMREFATVLLERLTQSDAFLGESA